MPVPSAKLSVLQTGALLQEFVLTQVPFTLGCAAENTLVLGDDAILPTHAEILWQSDHYEIVPRSQQAKLWINGHLLLAPTHHPLANGDEIRVGDTTIYFYEGQATVGKSTATRGSSQEPTITLPGTVVVSPATHSFVLQVTTAQWTEDFPLQKSQLILGRHAQCDIVIDLPMVSQRHAQLLWQGETYEIVDMGSTNGLMCEGEYVNHRLLKDGDVLSISDDLTLTYQVIPQTDVIERFEALNLRDRDSLTLGRDPRNDTVIDHPVVSRFHAQIELKAGTWQVRDLNSSNGTFVNNQQIREQRPLRPGDTIRIGPYHFQFNFDETLIQQNEAGNLRLDAVKLTKRAKDVILLNDISLSILPKEFVAIVGVSGAGKSTLLDALNGYRPATSGMVLVNQQNLYKHFNAFRTELGYVPQDDIIHRELTVDQALNFAAMLRLPADVTLVERSRQVQSVLQDLELTQRHQATVNTLSGGQRKRVSIGVELLTKPSLFFLDEATSGLDPGTETQMMRLLRRLADQGRTILLITHATKNVMLCNHVVFLAKGGRIAFFGPPTEALTYFGVSDFDEIYLKVAEERTPEAWEQRYRQSEQYQFYVSDRQAGLALASTHPTTARSHPPQMKAPGVSSWLQFWILTQRNLTILRQDRASLILMLALAPILGLLDFVMWQRNMFDAAEGNPAQAFTLLFLAVLIPVIVGSLATMREIVKEREIYRRERMIGLRILPYIFSKVGLGAILALYQAAIFLVTKTLTVDFPIGLLGFGAMYVTLFLATLGGMIMGLLVSALSPTPSVAPLLTILVLIPQITFAGSILSLDELGTPGQVISSLTISRWSYESMITLSKIGQDIAEDPCFQKAPDLRDQLTESEKREQCTCLGPTLFKRCQFPSLMQEYDPAVDQPKPIKPKEPSALPEPAGLSPAEYQQALNDYNDKVKTYTKDLNTWQDRYKDWEEKRGKAITAGEILVSRYFDRQGSSFAVNIWSHWVKLGLIMLGMLVILGVVQKRKDVI
jgi:ABC-type multidrug transport system ATPase subunit/pSer/pThr/pTyr-binding forkhead associated (FHA) protein